MNRGQRRGNADVGVLRVNAVGERCARARHHDARFLAERQGPLGKTRFGVDRDKVAALRALPGCNAERRDLRVQLFQHAAEFRGKHLRMLLH